MTSDFDDVVTKKISEYGAQLDYILKVLYNVENADDITSDMVDSLIANILDEGIRHLFKLAALMEYPELMEKPDMTEGKA